MSSLIQDAPEKPSPPTVPLTTAAKTTPNMRCRQSQSMAPAKRPSMPAQSSARGGVMRTPSSVGKTRKLMNQPAAMCASSDEPALNRPYIAK